MTTPLTERDLIQLNAYLDGELDAAERADVERRLAAEPALREELAGLRVTAALMGMADRVRAPRNFTLDPAVYGRPARLSFWDRLGMPRMAAFVGAGAMLVTVALCLGVMMLANFQPGRGGVAMAPAAEDAAMEAQVAVEEAAEAGDVAAFEPPAEPEEALESADAAEMQADEAEEAVEEAVEEATGAAADTGPAEGEGGGGDDAAAQPTMTATPTDVPPPMPEVAAAEEESAPVEPPVAGRVGDDAAANDGDMVGEPLPTEPGEPPARVTLLMVLIAVAAGLIGAIVTVGGLMLRARRR